MRLSVTQYVALMVGLFLAVYFLARFTSGRTEMPAPLAGRSVTPEPAVAAAPPFEQSADRITLGSGITPDPQTGALAPLDEKLKRLAALPDGPEKMQLGGEVGAIRDRSAVPVLLEWAIITPDRALLRSALDALGPLADAGTLSEIQRRYGVAYRSDDRYRLAKIVRNMTNPEAAPALIELAESADTPQPLSVAATEALATIATPAAVTTLLGRLAVADSDDTGRLRTAISRIDQPAALPALRFAALGNKDTPTEETRAAAVEALANFRDDETRQVLQQLTGDPAVVVRTAAAGVLARSR